MITLPNPKTTNLAATRRGGSGGGSPRSGRPSVSRGPRRAVRLVGKPYNGIKDSGSSSSTVRTMASKPIDLPSSYTSLRTTDITVSHVPASSPTPTPVVLVTLNRPRNHNAFTKAMEEELVHVFSLFDVDERVKCVVMTGAGKMFCAGADLDVGFPLLKGPVRETEHRDEYIEQPSQTHEELLTSGMTEEAKLHLPSIDARNPRLQLSMEQLWG